MVPIGLLFLNSFSSDKGGLSFQNYTNVFSSRGIEQTTANTLIFASTVTVLSTSLGLMNAYVLSRLDIPFKRRFETIIITPAFVSPIVLAMAWIILLSPKSGLMNQPLSFLGLPTFNVNSLPGMILVESLWLSPLSYLIVSPAFKLFNTNLEEASLACGASNLHTFKRIVLPLVLPGVISAAIIIFVASLGALAIPVMLGLGEGILTFGTHVFFLVSVRTPNDYGAGSSLAVVLIIVTLILFVFQTRFTALQSRFITVTGGQALAPRLIRLGRWRPFVVALFSGYVFLAIISPFLALLYNSLLKFTPGVLSLDLTFHHYIQLLSRDSHVVALKNTLFLALVGPLLAVILSLVIVFILHRTNWKGRTALHYLSTLPIGMPPLAVGLAFLWWFLAFKPLHSVYGTIWVFFIVYLVRFIPLSIRPLSAAIIQLHPELEEVSRACGASRLRTFRSILVPLLRHGLLSAWALLFIYYFIEFNAAIFLWAPGSQTVPLALWDSWEVGDVNAASALAVITVAIMFVAVLVAQKVLRVDIARW